MSDLNPLITEWLAEYAALQEHEVRSFASEHEHNHEIASAVHALLSTEGDCEDTIAKSNNNESTDHYKLLEKACEQLFSFYRSREVELQRFTLQFIPTLIYTYLSTVARGDKSVNRCVETLLIGIYNFEVVDESGKAKVISFRLPSLAQPSIYHEPLSLAPQFLTESALRRWEECNTKLVSWGPHPQVEVLNAQNRLKVMTALLFVYNRQISSLPKMALRHFCLATSKMMTQGFQSAKDSSKSKLPRVPVSSQFLLELCHAAYFAIFNEFYTLAVQAVHDIDQRASYELLPEAMVVTSAIINSLANNPSGQPCDGPMGISVALSPATTTVTMSRSMITNASFRTEKLPEDITIPTGAAAAADAPDVLTSITEEDTDGQVQRGVPTRASKPKLVFSALTKKSKDGKSKSEKKVTLKETSRGSRTSLSGADTTDSTSPMPQKKHPNEVQEVNGSFIENEKMCSIMTDSLQNSIDSSDAHSHMTNDSLDIDTTPRMAAMQVSSV